MKKPFRKFAVRLKYLNKNSIKKGFGNIHWLLEVTNRNVNWYFMEFAFGHFFKFNENAIW